MSKSLLRKYSNSTLYFQTQTAELEEDALGNKTPKTITIEAKAVLQKTNRPPDYQEQPGQSLSEIKVQGYLVDPLKLPVQPPCTVETIIDGHRGKLRISQDIRNPFSADYVEKYAGQKIEGYFREQGS